MTLTDEELKKEEDEAKKILKHIRLNPEKPYFKPVTITIEGEKGEEGTIEAYKTLKMLNIGRDVEEISREEVRGRAIIKIRTRRRTRKYEPPAFGKKETRFPMDDGNMLVLTETPNGINVEIRENLKPDSRTNLENLVTLIQHLTSSNSEVKEEYSDTRKLKITMHIDNINEEICKQSIEQTHRNLSVGLIKTIEDIERRRRAEVRRLVDDVTYYDNEPMDPSAEKKLKEKAITTNFKRELQGILSTKIRPKKYPKGIPFSKILSDSKKRSVVMVRNIGMYVLRKALKLPYEEIGKIFGYPGTPKNHATVLSACKEKGEDKKFNPHVGINPSKYSAKNNGTFKYSVEELVDDALEKYKAVEETARIDNFTKELLGVLSTNIRTESYPTGIPPSEILSNKIPQDVVMARAIGLYVLRKAFPKLSATDIGRIFGNGEKAKKCSTVTSRTVTSRTVTSRTVTSRTKEEGQRRQFNPHIGMNPSEYSAKNNGTFKYSVEELVDDALEKYKAFHFNRAIHLIRT